MNFLKLFGFYKHDPADSPERLDKVVNSRDSGSAMVALKKGIALAMAGRHENSLTHFDRATRLDPTLEIAWFNKGVAHQKLGHHNDAIKAFEEALGIKAASSGTWLNKGISLEATDAIEDAAYCYKEAIRVGTWEDQSDAVVALVQLGDIEQLMDRWDQAIEAFGEALRLDPGDIQTRVKYGVCLVGLGRIEEGVQFLDAIRDLHTKLEGYFDYSEGKLLLIVKTANRPNQLIEVRLEKFVDRARGPDTILPIGMPK